MGALLSNNPLVLKFLPCDEEVFHQEIGQAQGKAGRCSGRNEEREGSRCEVLDDWVPCSGSKQRSMGPLFLALSVSGDASCLCLPIKTYTIEKIALNDDLGGKSPVCPSNCH